MKLNLVPYLFNLLFILISAKFLSDFEEIALQEEVPTQSYTFRTLFENENGYIFYKEGKLTYECKNLMPLDEAFLPFSSEFNNLHQLVINNCKTVLKTTLARLIQDLNITTGTIDTLYIVYNDEEPLKANYSLGLNINTFGLKINHKSYDFFKYNPNFFQQLPNLTSLMVYGAKVPDLPKTVHLKALSLHISYVQSWESYCSRLEVLKLETVQPVGIIPEVWPENCSHLKALDLEFVTVEGINRLIKSNLTRTLASLRSLILSLNDLKSIPLEFLETPKELQNLDASGNLLTDNSFVNFPILRNLTYLNLAANQLNGYFLFDLLKKLPKLRELDVSYNNFFNLFCNYKTNVTSLIDHTKNLEHLSFEGMEVSLSCFEGVTFSKLKYLNLLAAEHLPIKKFKIQNLPRTNASGLRINLQNHVLETIDFSSKDYELLKAGNFSAYWGTGDYSKTNLSLDLTSGYLDCDCENYWFVKAMRELPNFIKIDNLRCRDSNADFAKQSLSSFNCSKLYSDDCIFRNHQNFNASARYITLNCSGIKGNFEFPSNSLKVIDVNVSNNYIESVEGTIWPLSVKSIDLRGNRLSRLSAEDASRLFVNPDRVVYLSRNLLLCDCDSKEMLDALHDHSYQILDFEEIDCVDSNRTLSSITSYEVCLTGQRNALAIVGTIVTLLLLVTLVLWRYRFQVQIYLFSRGWCLFCFSDDDLEPERPFDIFLSFSHGDEEFVINDLLPKLEAEQYRVCVHYRDWAIGDWIPIQIMRSVSLSKRTIIVLSKNFVQSLWGSLEFRYAIASSAKEGKSRLLVLVVDDVLSGELDGELQGYLSHNTYLRCDDPWFWEKLRYAMPRHKLAYVGQAENRERSNQELNEEVVLEPIIISQPVEQSS